MSEDAVNLKLIQTFLTILFINLFLPILSAKDLQSSCRLLFTSQIINQSERLATTPFQQISQPRGKKEKRLFSTKTPLELTIKADFSRLKKIANSKGFYKAPDRDTSKYTVPGQIIDPLNPSLSLNISLRPRGNSSLKNDMPKLKIDFVKDMSRNIYRENPNNEIDSNFRLNTHLSHTSKDTHNIVGYLNSEQTPIRESLAYAWANILGLETPKNRLAKVTYENVANNKSVTRYGLILETNKDIKDRINLPELDAAAFAIAEKSNIDPELGAKIHLFHKMIGNDDYGLRVNQGTKNYSFETTYRPLYNIRLFAKESGEVIPVISDFDLSTLVYGVNHFTSEFVPDVFFGLKTRLEAFFMYRFLLMRQNFSHSDIIKAIKYFKSLKSNFYQAIEDSKQNNLLDEEGYINAKNHLDVFFNNIDRAMKLKIITELNVPFYKDKSRNTGKLKENPIEQNPEDIGFIRPGTPVIELEREGNLIKVAILDLNGYLKEGEDSIGYIPAETNLNQKSVPLKIQKEPDFRDWQL